MNETGARHGWQGLADSLRAQIRAGDYRPGERFPAEEALRQEHGLSRTSVRRAVGQLVAEGLVEIRPPVGTFIPERVDTVLIGIDDRVTAATALTVTWADGSATTYPAGTRFAPR
jgi:DNA-binding FadR family transcriptional regulator